MITDSAYPPLSDSGDTLPETMTAPRSWFDFGVDLTTEISSDHPSPYPGVQMTFERYTVERQRCAKDLFTVTMRMGELEEALVLEADGGIEATRLEVVLESARAEGERLEERLLQLEGSIRSL
jgi:hypothetical protein